ncbi:MULTISPECIES: RNA 2',3'-cyclic phosphodiesterase [Shewanella]|uniref:RNA 2',3'-cyclic phosphodiesterase n=1 Tax=Shewanella TaxID=22 RepID=UPI00057A8E2B|nr:RNA 2',3'-cyclic phosphodiesterase [Shewanella sp. ECSMB14102]
MSPITPKRLFLGFSPAAAERASLLKLQLACEQAYEPSAPSLKKVTEANLHLTLAFLGQVTAEQLEDLLAAIPGLPLKRFRVRLEHLCFWPEPKILCLAGIAEDPALMALAKAAQQLAAALGLHSSEYDYRPHITLMRRADNLPELEDVPTLDLTPSELQLYESLSTPTGVEYRILTSWPLSD